MYNEHEQLTIDQIHHDPIPQSGVYSILRNLSTELRELKDTQYEFHRETDSRLSRLEQSSSKQQGDISELKQDVAVLKSEVSGLKEEVKGLRQDMTELTGSIKELTGNLSGMQTRFNWWLVIAGLVLAALQYFKG